MRRIITTLLLLGIYYPRIMTVKNIETETEIVTCNDAEGNLWAFYGTENYEIGTEVFIIMDSKGTKEIFDDSIIEVYQLPKNN